MSRLRGWGARLAGSFGSPSRDAEMEAEMDVHLQMEVDELVRRGVDPQEALRRARIRSGGVEAAKEAYRDQRGFPGIDWLRRDVRYALRGLARRPTFTVVAVVTLALGIGANTATFSLFDQAFRAALPVPEPGRLVNLGAGTGSRYSQSCGMAGPCESVFSYGTFRELERAHADVVRLAGHRAMPATVAYGGEPVVGEVAMVSGSYFPTLEIAPALGRLLGPDDDRVVGGHPVAVLGHAFWQSRLGGDPSVVGRTIDVNGARYDVVGVAPEGFDGTTFLSRPLVFVPLTMRSVVTPGWEGFEERLHYWVYVFGRLAEGVGPERAASALNVTYRAIVADVEAPLHVERGARSADDPWIAGFAGSSLTVEDGRRGQSIAHSAPQPRVVAILLFLTAGAVLFIACANIANILLARGVTRGVEMAVRLSLGAARWHLVRQLVLEAVVLAVLGGAAGLFVARAAVSGAVSMLPAEAAGLVRFEMSGAVLAFAFLLSMAVGILFGIVPALQSTRRAIMESIRASSSTFGLTRSARVFRASLVNVQVALSLALLIAAGLFAKSLSNVRAEDIGMDVDEVVTFRITPDLNRYAGPERDLLFEQVEREVATLPGVTAVSSAEVPLLAGSSRGMNVRATAAGSEPIVENTNVNVVGPGFAAALGMELVAGREFGPSDAQGAAGVAMVNEAFVERFGLGSGAVGARAGFEGDDATPPMEIVGVLGNAAYREVRGPTPAVFFVPWRQGDEVPSLTFYVRSSAPPAATMTGIGDVMRRIDPSLPVERLRTMTEQVGEGMIVDRLLGRLSVAFAAVATLLATLGLYGVVAYSVATRTREIGVRMALGARLGQVRAMVLGQAARSIAIGAAVGFTSAFVIGRLAEALLYRTNGSDPFVFGASTGVLALAAALAAYLPARRASAVDPMTALRSE